MGYKTPMKTFAIISEFNPFHNGHKYILEKSKNILKNYTAISLMSGDFVQRGDPSIIDKFSRAKSAMYAGFDMIIEMPIHISLQAAEFFAKGSVILLDKIGVNYLCFGIENLEAGDFLEKSYFLIENNDKLERLTRKNLENKSFAKARYDSIASLLNDDDFISSNNILAFEYIRAINNINSNINVLPIKRISSLNQDDYLREDFISSSTAIRKNIYGDYKNHLPTYSYNEIENFKDLYNFANYDYFYEIFKFLLLIKDKDMKNIIGYEEGLDNYLKKIANEEKDINTFLERSTSKRLTTSRIKRLMLNYILENTQNFNDFEINFYKVLAFNKKSEPILRNPNLNSFLCKNDRKNLSESDKIILDKMIEASNLFSLATGRPLNVDYTNKVIKL